MNDWKSSSYLNLSTQKRDGSWVNTPVWFSLDGDNIYLFSEGKAGKVKRIRNFSLIKICPCTVTGKLTGDWQEATANIISSDTEKKEAHTALLRKYKWQMYLLDIGASLANKKSKRAFIKIRVN